MAAVPDDATSEQAVKSFAGMWEMGMTADFCADQVFGHLAEGKFYCLLSDGAADSPSIAGILQLRYEGMLSRRMPTNEERSAVSVSQAARVKLEAEARL